MNILIVDDDEDLRLALTIVVERAGHTVTQAACGNDGWDAYQTQAFEVVITDWRMPDMSGPDLCRMIRARYRDSYSYMIVLTANTGSQAIIEALEAGADDFMTKPFDAGVLVARLRVAARILKLHSHVTVLEGILSVCSYCKQIRRDDGTWATMEKYIEDRSALRFSHGICPPCTQKHFPNLRKRK